VSILLGEPVQCSGIRSLPNELRNPECDFDSFKRFLNIILFCLHWCNQRVSGMECPIKFMFYIGVLGVGGFHIQYEVTATRDEAPSNCKMATEKKIKAYES